MKHRKKEQLIETAVMLYQEVYRYAFARVKEKATAQEIAQNVMETVIRKIEGLEKEGIGRQVCFQYCIPTRII